MLKRVFLFVICMNLLPLYIFAQQKWKPGGVAEVGLLMGSFSVDVDWRGQFLLSKNGWSAGVGAGIDYYLFRTVPVYLQGRKWIGQRKNKPFVLASAGINFAALYPSQHGGSRWGDVIMPGPGPFPGWWTPIPYHYENGVYAEAGGGYSFLGKKQHGLTLSLSWVHKSITEWYETDAPININPGQKDRTTNLYQLNRLVFRVGFKW